MRFRVYCKDILIGHSDLEFGDPPMGVALGRFVPDAAYDNVCSDVIESAQDQKHLELSVIYNGDKVPCAGVGITDYSKDLGLEGMEVTVLGIPYPLYGEIFPDHVARYDKQFKK